MDKPTIRTPHDLTCLDNYLDSIDPKRQPLRRIVTGYYLNSEYPCGLKSCHQPHKEGFLVELEDGHLTNVGWKCGEHFGEKFALERNRYAELQLRPKAISAIQDLIQKLQPMRQALEQLAVDAERLSQYKQGLRRQFPSLYRNLERRAHEGRNRVTEQVERSSKEIEDIHAMNPGSNRDSFRYRDEFRGVIPGLGVFTVSLHNEVITRLTSRVTTLISVNVPTLPTKDLLEWEGWAGNFNQALKVAQSYVAAGYEFFAPECFKLLGYIALDTKEKAAISSLRVSALLNEASSQPDSTTIHPSKLSKKQRDTQKRLAAILKDGKR